MPNRADTQHFLRRAAFGATNAEADAYASLTVEQLVDSFLDLSGALPENEPTALTTSTSNTRDIQAMGRWWINRMLTNPAPLQEKMTLFWHGLWTSSLDEDDIENGPIYRQNRTWRANCLTTDFPAFCNAMAVDPAMLLYLDNASNRRGRPNENFARELFELFTLGEGNYTEADIVECARAWTGFGLSSWTGSPDTRTFVFSASRHDPDTKTIFGQSGAFTGPDVITTLICGTGPGGKRDVMSRWIARKVFEFFGYPGPPAAVVEDLAAEFRASNLSVRALVRATFLHPEFWSPAARTGLVRTPVEWMVAVIKALGLTADRYSTWTATNMGQVLFAPPDVSGWRPNAYWCNPTAWWGRASFLDSCLNALGGTSSSPAGVLASTATLAPAVAVDTALDLFGVDRASTATRTRLVNWLTGERTAGASAQSQQRNLIRLVAFSPEFCLA